MSQVVEDLIVAMGFDNKQFEAGVKISMATLNTLKNNLNFGAKANGLDDIQASANKLNLSPIGTATEGISAKFVAMSAVALTALTNIVNKAVDAGLNVAKAFTVAPVSDGFAEYETKIGSIQTILANTAKDGTGLAEVTANLDELNAYADKTIYSFGDMTKNIGLFTNAGIGVGDATKMIQGFSNEAAASGTTAEGAAGAAYQLSQALSAGTITLMDWKSLTNVGMGNANMKDGIIQIAEAMGAFEGTTVTAEDAAKDFNGTLEKKWLSADVMENYLKIQAEGNEEVNRATIKGLGLSDAQADAFIKTQKTSEEAATKVRTFSGLMGTLKEAAGSSWASSFDIILGDFDSATTLFTGISNTLGGMLGSIGDARNELLQGWADLGGRTILLDGLKNVFEGLMSVLRPIKEAFNQIFPPTTAATLFSLTESFQKFSQKLTVGAETADKLKRTFAGVFAIFSIGWEIVKGIFGVFGDLFGAVSGGSGGFLSLTATIGDFLVKVRDAIKDGDVFKNIFTVIGTVLKAPIALLSNLGTALGELVGSLGSATGMARQFFDILFKGDFTGGPLSEDSKIVDILFKIRAGFEAVTSIASQLWNVLAKGDFIGGFFEEDSPIIDFLFDVREAISKFFSSDGLKLILGGAAGVGLAVAVKSMIQKAFKFGSDDGDSFFGTIKDAFGSVRDAFDNVGGLLDGVTNSFKAMQQNLQAGTLLKIGAAIGIVALSLKLLSTIDPGDLAVALGGVVGAMTALMVAMTILTKIGGTGAFATMPAVAIGLMALATAVLILSVAMKSLAGMSWEELGKGLAGLAGMLGLLVAAAYGLSKAEGSLIRAGIAMIPLAVAIRILVSAVEDLGSMDWDVMLRGLGGLAGILIGVTTALNFMPTNMVAIGVGLAAVAGAMLLFTVSIEKLGNMDISTLVQGLIGVGAALVIIAGALQLMPKDMVAMSAGLILVSLALVGITASVLAMGSMSWEDLAKGLIGLAGALGAIAIALIAMTGTLAGSAALGVAAIGLGLLLPSIVSLSLLSWGQLLVGLAGLAGSLTILGVAGLLLTPVVPTLLGLGAALALMGVGMMAAGVGAGLLGTGLTALIGVLNLGPAAITALLESIGILAAGFATAILAFLTTIASHATEFATAFKELALSLLDAFIEIIPKIEEVITQLLTSLVNIIVENAPKIGEAVTALIATFLQVLRDNVPPIISTVFDLMIAFLSAIRDRIPEVVTVVTDIIVAFIGALQNNLPRIVQAGFDFIIGFMNSLADSIRQNVPLVFDAAINIADAIIDGVVQGIKNGLSRVLGAAKDMAASALNAAKDFLGIASPSKEFTKVGGWSAEGLARGIDNGQNLVAKAGAGLARGLLGSVNDELGQLGGTAKTVWDILSRGDYTNNGGLFDEDSDVVDRLFKIREGFMGLGGALNQAWALLSRGDLISGPWQADSPVVDTLAGIHQNLEDVGIAAEQAWNLFSTGDFKNMGPWQEDTPVTNTLADIKKGLDGVKGAGQEAWDVLNSGDFKGDGPWDEDSPIVSTLLDIREGFEEFHGVGENAIQGLIDGFNQGATDVAKAAHDMAVAALTSAREALGIQSPSKEFQTIGEYSIEGLLTGLKNGEGEVNGQGKTIANGLVNGFSKGLGKEMPKAFASIFETLKTGAADVKFWGPNSPITTQLQGLNAALKEADLNLAAFYGEVNLADPASIQAYAETTGNSLKYLTGLLNGMEKAANKAFEMLESGKGLDVVLGDEDVLNNLVDGILSVIPGVEAMLVRLGLAVVDGLLGIFFNTSVMGIVGKFITWAVRQVGAIFGIKFPVEEELADANKELRDFLVNVEDTQGRFEKLSDAGIAALTDTLAEANDAVDDIDRNPVITPILDLTEYNKAKGGMDAEVPMNINPQTSSAQASSVYNERSAIAEAEAIAAASKSSNTLEFNQYNNSPIPLGHVEIYKQTQGQLAMAKEALGVS